MTGSGTGKGGKYKKQAPPSIKMSAVQSLLNRERRRQTDNQMQKDRSRKQKKPSRVEPKESTPMKSKQSQGEGKKKAPRGGPGGADTQAPPPASTPPQGPPSLGHNGPPAPQQQQQQPQQPPQGPPAHSGPPSGTSTLTRERKRIAIIDPTTRQEVSVDGTSADKKVRVHPRVPSVLTPILTQKLRFCHFPCFFAHLNPVYCQLGSHSGRITQKTN